MADFATKKDLTAVPNRVGAPTLVVRRIDPATLPSYPGIGDTISFFDVPAGAYIVDSWIKVSANIGAASSTLQLQANYNGSATTLTGTLAATTAGGARQTAVPPTSLTYPGTIQAAVATAALNAAGTIEAGVLYSFAG